MLSELHALILAAGKGTRMKSELPKVVHPILGRPMVAYVIDAVKNVGCDKTILVTGFRSDVVKESLKAIGENLVDYVEQKEQLGTGHAVQCYARAVREPSGDLLVVCGDTPLISTETLKSMVELHRSKKPAITMMTLKMKEPGNYGRILRDSRGNVAAIREANDCSEQELSIKEVNLAVYLFDSEFLFKNIFNLKPNNKQGEYYLTDLIEAAVSQGEKVLSVVEKDESSTLGINSRQHLAEVGSILQKQILNRLMDSGVSITNPAQTLIGPKVCIGPDSVIEPNSVILGNTVIGKNCVIGPNVKLDNVTVADDKRLLFCVVENAKVDSKDFIAPFSSVKG